MNKTPYSDEHYSPYDEPVRLRSLAATESTASSNTKNKLNEKESELTKFFSFFTGVRFRIILGSFLIAFALYAFVVTISSFFTYSADQSLLDAGNTNPEEVSNIGKLFGALVANTIFTKWIGIGAFVLIFYIAMLGLRVFRAVKFNFLTFTIRCLLVAIVASIVAGLFTVTSPDLSMFIGGYHGYNINAFLVTYGGFFLAYLVSGLLIIVVLSVFFNDIVRLAHAYKLRIREARELHEKREKEKAAETSRINGMLDSDVPDTEKKVEKKSEVFVFDGDSRSDKEANQERKRREKREKTADNSESTNVGDMAVTKTTIEQADQIEDDSFDPTAELPNFKMPSISLLSELKNNEVSIDQEEQEENKARIIRALENYGITIKEISATVGPTVTLYEIVPSDGIRISKIRNLEDDIMMYLSAKGIRIIAPIPGKGAIGIEVPNKEPQTVSIRSVIASKKFQESRYHLPVALGATIANDVYVADLAKMPHLLVAGATGQGKSVGLNVIIASLLYKKHPSELKFVMIDPKAVEFSLYSKIENHYLAKLPDAEEAIVTDMKKVVNTLNSLCIEMDNRYNLLKDAGVRSVEEYNAKFISRRLNPEKGHKYMPYIVVIVDEFADLIMSTGKEVESPVCRVAQKGRAAGMHMIIATQRPSTNVLTGTIKANFPSRMAFKVSQMVDSRTILDRPGAQHLIGKGDMLLLNGGEIDRIQCAFIKTEEVESICDCINSQTGFVHPYLLPEYIPEVEGGDTSIGGPGFGDRDTLFEEAARFIVNSGVGSTSSLQRHYQIGYNRAGRLMDQIEAAGIVGPSTGGKPRQILVDTIGLDQILSSLE